jgi:methylated-DNA-[protein]-cysteine S-methyltransferase
MRPIVVLHAKEIAGRWFGVACCGDAVVATTVRSTRARALATLRRSLPAGVERRGADARGGEADETIAMLAELEAGDETRKRFSLARELVGEPRATVLLVAAAIPIGCVTSYGQIARAAGAEARVVGAIMAGNPLYPIVPCHRVVGADFSLVGYTGSRDPAALEAKLARLSREARGVSAEQDVMGDGRPLRVYPVEWAITKARRLRPGSDAQRTLFG